MAKPQIASEVGFDPEMLDDVVKRLVGTLKHGLDDIDKLRPLIETVAGKVAADILSAQGGDNPYERACQVDQLLARLERYSKLLLNLTKTTDELARLRSFAAGGADARPDVAYLSDAELEDIILKAAKGLQAERQAEDDGK